jgi:hypothetical protein
MLLSTNFPFCVKKQIAKDMFLLGMHALHFYFTSHLARYLHQSLRRPVGEVAEGEGKDQWEGERGGIRGEGRERRRLTGE